ncbi:MAG: hypothetical protein Q9163_005416 [Psora crenata]
MDASQLIHRPADVTRSTVQKAVVVIADKPQLFGQLKENLSMVTGAWFAQRDFADVDILEIFQENLASNLHHTEDDPYLGNENPGWTGRLGLICSSLDRDRLEDSADPQFDSYARNLVMPTSLKTSERNSLLAFMGLPLQLFGKGSLFCPYIPLQQLDILANYDTKSYIVGSTNSLLLQQKDRYSDVLINLDESIIDITSSSLRSALALSAADRRWIDFLIQTVVDNWDESNPSRPKTMGYLGSEEFVRLQFEEYLLALLSSVKYHLYLQNPQNTPMSSVEGNPTTDFNPDWVHAWQQTSSFALFNKTTDSHLFDIVEPHHPTAGNMNIDDVQRRLVQQIQTLHLDERFATGKEALNKHLAIGQKKVSTALAYIWSDLEAMREAQRKRQLENHPAPESKDRSPSPTLSEASSLSTARALAARAPDLTAAQTSVHAAGQRAGAYLSSWGAWAVERRKGWARQGSSGENELASAEGKVSKAPSLSKLPRWNSAAPSTVYALLSMSIVFYRRPDYVAKLPGPMSQSQCQLYVDRTQKHKRSIPPELSFDNIIQNKALPPCSLQDFMDYSTYIAHDAENLQFFMWLQDYTKRFYALPRSEQVLSPPWTFNTHSSVASASSSSPPLTAPSAGASKTTSGVSGSEYSSVFHDVELGLIVNERSSSVSGTTRVNTPENVSDVNTKAGLKWQSFTIQPYHNEVACIITHYLSPNSPRELNISQNTRTKVLRALQHTTHPSAFGPLLEMVETSLRRQSHPNFIRWSICNGNKPRVLFVQYTGILQIFLAMVLATFLILSHASRWWRILVFPLLFVGIDIFVAAYKGLCVIIHTNHNRALRPWEQFPPPTTRGMASPENLLPYASTNNIIVPPPIPFSSSKDPVSASFAMHPFGDSNVHQDEHCSCKYGQLTILQKIFTKTVRVQNEAVKVLQDRIVWQSHFWAAVVAVPLTAIVVALPVADVL